MVAFMLSTWCGDVHAEPVRIESFGMHVHELGRGKKWPETTFGFLRLWDSHTTWRDIQPAKNSWRFRELDRHVEEAEGRGVRVLMTLGQTPQWAARNREADSPYGEGASSPPADIKSWATYVRTLANRYRGRIKHWEIWNEINVPHFWSGDIREMVELERVAAEILKEADPSNFVLTPSVQGGGFKWLDRYMGEGGGSHADAISYHFYAVTSEPEEIFRRVHAVREIAKRHGFSDKPIWNTETGWLLANSDGGFGGQLKPSWETWKKVNYQDGAGFVVRALLANFSSGINHVFWYSWNNKAMGLAEDSGRKKKPAAVGFERAVNWLVGNVVEGCENYRGIWQCKLTRDGIVSHIVWSREPRKFLVPRAWDSSAKISISGDESIVEGGARIIIGNDPTLFRSSGGGR